MKSPPPRPTGDEPGDRRDPRRTSSGAFPAMPRRAAGGPAPPDPGPAPPGGEETIDFGPAPTEASSGPAGSGPAGPPAAQAPRAGQREDAALVGRVLGNFRLERLLGKGGMAVVYLARQLDLDREVAVKVLSSRLTQDPRQVEQFAREAKTIARLEHQNVVTVYAFGKEEDGTCWLAVQLVRGGSLRELLQEKKRLSAIAATSFVVQIARGLLEAHRLGIIHRDVKPDNVLVASGPTLKLTDFGLARMAGDPGASFGADEVVGTPHYMSPEQVDAAPDIDARTDVYALGATFYHLLTGVTPFSAKTTLELLLKHVGEPLVPPHERVAGVPADLSKIVCRMMAKDRAQRYASLEDVLRDLEAPSKAAEAPAAAAEAAERVPALLLAEHMPPLRAEVVRAARPRSLSLAALGLMTAAGLSVGLGLGPIRAVLADPARRHAPLDAREEAARQALVRLRRELAGQPPPEQVERLREFAAARAGTASGVEVAAEVARLDEEAARALAKAAGAALDEVERLATAGQVGQAAEALAALPDDQRAAADERAKALRARVEGDLAARGVRWVPAGPFSSRAGGRQAVVRQVTTRGFYVDAREVTAADFARFVAATGEAPPTAWRGPAPPDALAPLPVTGVTTRQAAAYAAWRGGRLPEAVEWEKAARGVEGGAWPWGDEEHPQACNWAGGGPGRAVAPGDFPRDVSPYGCLDMAGNVAELALPQGAGGAAPGGAWAMGGSYLTRSLACARGWYHQDVGADEGHPAVGFRCAYDALPPPPAGQEGGR